VIAVALAQSSCAKEDFLDLAVWASFLGHKKLDGDRIYVGVYLVL
jgi:hypothetical protein